MRAIADLTEKGDRIKVTFNWDPAAVEAIKRIPGRKFVPRDKGGPFWALPRDLISARLLRKEFGDGLQLTEEIKQWGREQVNKEVKLRTLSSADDFDGEMKIDRKIPELSKWFRPYQRADVMFLATTNALNLLEPRLGKTTETVAAIYEADLEHGPHLVIAPQKSLDSVWRMEIERWTDGLVFTYSGDRKSSIREFEEWLEVNDVESAIALWWITTADMIRRGQFPQIERWRSITIDEFHKTGLAEIKNKFPKAVKQLKAERKFALSGTPMGGKPVKLFGGLQFLEPEAYTSKWRWADTWLQIEDGYGGHKKILGIKSGLEDEFYKSLAPHAIRRTREEVLPQLPPKQPIDVWCEMTPKQRAQYNQFAADAEIRIDEHHLSATSILAEYTRLKQFANSYCEVEVKGVDPKTEEPILKVLSTPNSGKLPYLLERLAEVGIDPEDPAGEAQAIVASQFRDTIEMVSAYLAEKGIPNISITGKVSKAESERAQRAFKAGQDSEGLRVCCMVTTMGVGITLDNVESVHVLDETWNPDDQEQLTDRAINTTRLHQVSVFTYRSLDSIEHKIHQTNIDKAWTNKTILDLRRQGFKVDSKRRAA